LADYCVCDGLVQQIVEIVGRVKSFDINTALDALELGEKLAEDVGGTLKQRAMQYIIANFETVAKEERFHKLVNTTLYYQIIAAVYQVVKAALAI
jgi:hypothetical protein